MANITAKLRYLHIAPRKVNLVGKLIRGMEVEKAKAQLKHLAKRASLPLQKLINSALANAHHNFHLPHEEFVIKEITVTQGPMLKRSFPRSRGRVDMKRKRMSHVTLVLEEKQSSGVQAKAQKSKR